MAWLPSWVIGPRKQRGCLHRIFLLRAKSLYSMIKRFQSVIRYKACSKSVTSDSELRLWWPGRQRNLPSLDDGVPH